MTLKYYLLIVAAMAGLASCSTSNAWYEKPCFFPDAPQTSAPPWVCHPRSDQSLITAVGYAPKSSAGVSFSRQMAVADARVKLAKTLQGQCGVRYVSEAMLSQSRVLAYQRSPRGGQFVQVGILPSDLRLDCR